MAAGDSLYFITATLLFNSIGFTPGLAFFFSEYFVLLPLPFTILGRIKNSSHSFEPIFSGELVKTCACWNNDSLFPQSSFGSLDNETNCKHKIANK